MNEKCWMSGLTKLKGRDSSPGLSKVSTVKLLQLWGAGGVVRHNHVDKPRLQRRPQFLLREGKMVNAGVSRTDGNLPRTYLVLSPSDWWAALELGGARGDILRRQTQVVVGGLHRQRCSGLPGLADQMEWLCWGQVDDVAADPAAERGTKWQLLITNVVLLAVLQEVIFIECGEAF